MLVFIASCINFDLSKGIFSFPKNKTMESMVSARSLFRNYGFLFMQQILVGYGSCLLNFHYSLKKVKLLIMKRVGFFFFMLKATQKSDVDFSKIEICLSSSLLLFWEWKNNLHSAWGKQTEFQIQLLIIGKE